MYANRCQIDFTSSVMRVTREPVANNTSELFLKSSIVSVTPIYEDVTVGYRFPTMTVVRFHLSDGNKFDIELQEVTNNATWSDGTLEALQKFVNDFNDGEVTGLTEYYHTFDSVMLEWDDNGYPDFDIYYGPTPLAAPNSGTAPTTTSVTNSKLITGLAAETQYDFYVRTNPNGGWSGPYTMTTAAVDLIFTIDTTKTSAGSTNSTSFRPTLRAGQTYNCEIFWGDGSSTIQVNATSPTKVYAAPGVYTVRISGTFYGFNFNNTQDRLKMISITNWGNIVFGATQTAAFRGCANLNVAATDLANFSLGTGSPFANMFNGCTTLNPTSLKMNVANASSLQLMFVNCTSLNNCPDFINNENVVSLSSMFQGCTTFNKQLVFDTSNVITFSGLFFNSGYNQYPDFSVQSAEFLNSLFSNCTSFNQSVDQLFNSPVVDASAMLAGCTSFNQPISIGASSLISTVNSMLAGCTSFNSSITINAPNLINTGSLLNAATIFNLSVANINTTNVTSMDFMFSGATAFNQDISSQLNFSSVTSLRGFLLNCINFNQPINITSSTLTNVHEMLRGCSNFTSTVTIDAPLTNVTQFLDSCFYFNSTVTLTSTVITTFNGMFKTCGTYNQPITGFSVTSAATNLLEMFYNCGAFNQPVNHFNVSSVTDFSRMFFNCIVFDQPVDNWIVGTANLDRMFLQCPEFESAIFSTAKPTSLSSTFAFCEKFNQNINTWDVSVCTNFQGTFSFCTVYNQPLSSWITSSALVMDYMFQECTAFNQSVSSFVTTLVGNFSYMFENCIAFNQPVPFDTSSGQYFNNMFEGCTIFNQAVNGFSMGFAADCSFMFKNATAFNQPVNLWDVQLVEIMSNMFENATAFNQSLSSWQPLTLFSAENFMLGKTDANYSTANLDALYNSWSLLTLQPNVVIDFGTIKYTAGGSAGKAILEGNPNFWLITDGGI